MDKLKKNIKKFFTGFGDKKTSIVPGGQNYFEMVINNLPDSLIITDRCGIVTVVNNACCELLGYEKAELVGKSATLFFAARLRYSGESQKAVLHQSENYFYKILDELVQKGFVNNSDVVFIAKTGQKIPMYFNGIVLHAPAGGIAGILGLARDMRQIKRNSDKLTILKQIALLPLQKDDISELTKEMVGLLKKFFNADRVTFYTVADGILKSSFASDFIGDIVLKLGDGIAGYSAQIKKAYYTNDAYRDEHFHPEVDKKSGYITKNVLGYPVIYKDILSGVVEVINKADGFTDEDKNDITEIVDLAKFVIFNKMSEIELKKSEEKYRILFENISSAIFIADVETEIILDVNKQAEKLLDKTREEIIGMNRVQLHPAGESEYYEKHFQNHVKRGNISFSEAVVVKKDGTHVPVQISATVTEIQGKKVIQGIFQDITERKKAEEARVKLEAAESAKAQIEKKSKEFQQLNEELHAAKQKLEEKVKERTTELEKSRDELRLKVEDLEKFHDVAVTRELEMMELEKEIEKLKKELKRLMGGQNV